MDGYKIALTALSLALATALRWAFGFIWPDITDFVTFYPAVVMVALACGLEAGAATIVLAAVIGWWFFIPPPFAFFPLKQDHAVSLVLFVFSCVVILAMVEPYVRLETSEHERSEAGAGRDENEAGQARVLTWDEARRITTNIAKLPELLSRKAKE